MSVSSNELGEMLIDLGLLTSQQLVDAISIQQISGHRLTVVLAEMGLVSERQLKDALELQFGVNFVTLCGPSPPDETFIRLIPEDIERKFRFVPIAKSGNQHTVAMVDPDDLNAADMIRLHLGTNNFKKLVCTADDFEHLMKIVYEKVAEPSAPELEPEQEVQPEPTPDSVEVEKAVTNGAVKGKKPKSISPNTSQTKLKSHMRNLFGADSDDDLDDMFGGASGDNLDAVSEPTPVAEIDSDEIGLNESVLSEPEPVEAETTKKKPTGKKKSFTSLFDEDDDDDFGAAAEDTEAPPLEPVLEDADIELNPISKLKKTSKKSATKPAVEEAPQNQLLEHILKEADANPKPTKKAKGKKSMSSLFGDDDDMDFDEGTPAANDDGDAAPEAPSLLQDAEPTDSEVDDQSERDLASLLLHQEEVTSESSNEDAGPATTTSKNKSFRSLFDDDDDDLGLGGDDDSESEVQPESEVEAEPEAPSEIEEITEPEAVPEEVPEAEAEPELELVPEPEAARDTSEEEDGEQPTQETAPKSESKRSIATKQFRSLFDDEVEEDDLFGNEPTLSDLLTGDPMESPKAPDTMLDKEPVEEIDRSGEFSTESLLKAIDKPFQSLFDDEDDDEIFGTGDAESGPEKISEAVEAEPEQASESKSVSEESGSEPEPTEAAEIEPPTAKEEQKEEEEAELEFEQVPLAYQSSFDDDMDEDSLFASASHPIPEGAPQLRDLLSRFDDDDTGVHSIAEPVTGPPAVAEESVPEPVKKDAELAVSALLAALDEQVPDEPAKTKVESKVEPTVADDPGDQFSADRIIAELEAEEAPSLFSKIEEANAQSAVVSEAESKPEPEAEPEQVIVNKQGSIAPVIDKIADQLAADFFRKPSQEEQKTEPEVEPASKPVAAPKSRRLRALMSDMGEEDEFSSASDKKSDVEEVAASITSSAELTDEEESTNLRELLTAGRAEFEPVLPDHEILDETYGSSTTDLPPVVIPSQALLREPEPVAEMTQPPAVEAFDDPLPEQEVTPPGMPTVEETAASVEPAKRLTPTSLPEHSAEVPIIEASDLPPSMRRISQSDIEMPPLPETASELPDALEDVLASVTFDLMDNADLANLSGNRTEISFLEEIVESELAFAEEEKNETAAPSTVAAQQPAESAPQPAVLKSASDTVVPKTAAQPVETKAEPAAAVAETKSKTPAQQEEAAPLTELVPKGPEQLDPSILNLATQILTQAVNSECSDVHFEPLADGLALRFMSDGEVLDETILPAQIQLMLILCLKSMAGLDTKISDRPQDKKFTTRTFGDPVVMRITSIPGVHGEMVAVSLKT